MEGVAVVTGSGRGLGRAIAVRLASTGMKVVVNYRKREEEAQSTVDYINGINGEAISVKADVSRRDGCSELFKSAIEKFGRLDVLVNNAGLGIYGKFEDYDEKAIDLQLGASLKSAIFCSQEAARRMDRGSIVNVSSLAGVVPARGLAIYSSAKAAMIALTRSLALELGPRIRVNAVAPGIVETEMGMSLFNAMGVDANQWIKENTVTGNPVSAEDVAEIVHVLVTVNSIVGQTIIIDSGQSLVGGF